MINQPLKLRLRILPPDDMKGGNSLYIVCQPLAGLCRPGVLEFENPLNGTWHPVEIYDESAN